MLLSNNSQTDPSGLKLCLTIRNQNDREGERKMGGLDDGCCSPSQSKICRFTPFHTGRSEVNPAPVYQTIRRRAGADPEGGPRDTNTPIIFQNY